MNHFSNSHLKSIKFESSLLIIKKMEKVDQQITKLPLSLCPEHSLPYGCYCSHQSCVTKTRLCKKCKSDHVDHPKFYTTETQVVQDLKTGLKKCIDRVQQFDERTKQLDKLMNYANSKSKEEYQNMECKIIEEMKVDKSRLQTKLQKIEALYNKIEQKDRIKTYFAKLNQMNLLQLRIKLSNQQGMKNFKQKNQKLCQLIQKSSFEQYQRLHEQFTCLVQQFEYEIQNNTTFRIGQIIAMKNSKRQMTQKNALKKQPRQNNENQNQPVKIKQKAKPKTTLNFGQGIITGILNFLNI